MRAKTIVSHLVIAALFTGVGMSLTALLGTVEDSSRAEDSSDAFDRWEEREALSQARARVKELEDQLKDRPWIAESAKPTALPGAEPSDDAVPDAELARLRTRLEKVKAELAAEKAKNGPMSDDEMAATLRDAQDRFSLAMSSGDGAAAVQVLAQLTKLDKRAFPTVVRFWSELNDKKWLGMDWRQRRGWATAELFHWGLRDQAELAALGPDLAKKFEREAIWSLSRYEDDPKKQAETFAIFLDSQPRPDPLTKRDAARRGRNMGPPRDPYRSALRHLSQLPSQEASRILSRVATDPTLPEDVRSTAVRGLVRQVDDASLVALETATRDPDASVARRASVGLVKRDPPASGWLITSVTNKGQAQGLNIPVGAIITSYDGKPIRRDRDLYGAIRKTKGKESVALTVNYNGSVQAYSVKGGRIGVNGETVKSRDR